MGFSLIRPIVDKSVRELCYHPYPLHPKGCPNYGKKEGCPPKAKNFTNLIDTTFPVFAIWNVFDMTSHVQRMIANHPTWSNRQLVCCLYWQPKARKGLEAQIASIMKHGPEIVRSNYLFIRNPEATGINVTATMATIGEILEWPPVTKTYQVAIAGRPRK